jgi:hypothetical protein
MCQVAFSFVELIMRIACCFLILLFQPSLVGPRGFLWTQEPPKTYKVIHAATYEKVLDLVFQRGEANRDHDFVLRFEPTNAPESQISIKRTETKTQVVEFTSLSGNIYRKLDNILRNGGKEDAVEMAKQIQVNKRTLNVPAALANQWWTRLPDAMAATIKLLEQRRAEAARGVGTITIDGTYYSFSYDQVGSSVFVRVMDYEVSSREVTGETELVRWMNGLRCDIEKLK